MLWHDKNSNQIKYNKILEIKLNKIKPSLAGPKRPQDRIEISKVKENFINTLTTREKIITKSKIPKI